MNLISQPTNDQVIALAGLFQSASLVRELSRTDNYHVNALTMTARSLLMVEAETTLDVFGSIKGVSHGLDVLETFLKCRAQSSHREVLQYAVSMHQLQQRLKGSQTTQEVIAKGLAELNEQYKSFIESPDDMQTEEALQMDLANLYIRSLSLLTPRIIVQGGSGMMENPITVNQIRTVLFGGVRAAFLWKQLGGTRLKLVFQRNKYLQIIKELKS